MSSPFPPYIFDLTWSVTRPPIPIVARPTAIRRSWNQDSKSVKSPENLKTLLPEKIGRGLLINGALGIIDLKMWNGLFKSFPQNN